MVFAPEATGIHLGPSGTLGSPKISEFISLAAKIHNAVMLRAVSASQHLNPPLAYFWSEHTQVATHLPQCL